MLIYHTFIYPFLKGSSHIDDTTWRDSIRHDPFFRSPYNQILSAAERRGTPVLLSASVSDNFGNSPQIAAPRRSREIDQSTQRLYVGWFHVGWQGIGDQSDAVTQNAWFQCALCDAISYKPGQSLGEGFLYQESAVGRVTIKWISSHICSTTMSGRHDKKLLQQKSLWKRFLSCVAVTLSRKLLKKTFSIGILHRFHGVCNKSLSSRMVVSWYV